MPEHVTAAEAAELVGCSETHIRRLIKRGELNATKKNRQWRIARGDVDTITLDDDATDRPAARPTGSPTDRQPDRPTSQRTSAPTDQPTGAPTDRPTASTDWRADLLAQVARLEADKVDALRREQEAGEREERSKARIIDLERAATVRESRIADMDAAHADLLAAHASEVADLRGQVAILEAKVRETLEERAEENGQLANRIADLVTAQQEMQTRVYELEPVANQVPMLQAAVEEKDATLSERERELELREHELSNVRDDIEAIASRPVTGGVFRLLTKGKLRV